MSPLPYMEFLHFIFSFLFSLLFLGVTQDLLWCVSKLTWFSPSLHTVSQCLPQALPQPSPNKVQSHESLVIVM